MVKLIFDIDDDRYEKIKRATEGYLDCPISLELCNATILSTDVTNGDVIEKIFGKDIYCTLIRMMYSSCCEKLKRWWYTPYTEK